MSNMLSKFTNQSVQKSSTFPIKASFERSLFEKKASTKEDKKLKALKTEHKMAEAEMKSAYSELIDGSKISKNGAERDIKASQMMANTVNVLFMHMIGKAGQENPMPPPIQPGKEGSSQSDAAEHNQG